ncbi:MAG: hypothetical protein O6933_00865 [Planctomycetota bacterium]|nr:hypothetical protein [Planctomycetota bacterium]
MPAQLTATARRQGLKNALICGIGLLVLWLTVTATLSLLPGRKLLDSMMLSFALLWVVTFLAFLGTWVYGLNTRGRVLLDCGPPAHRRNYLMIAVLSLLGALGGGLAATPASPPLIVASPAFAVSFAAYWFIAATGRLQVRENGLWFYCNLLRWRKIQHYRWAPDSTLILTATLPLWFRGAVPVPPEHREHFDAFLTQHWSPTRGKAA